jgi:hypothetical protein
MSGLKICHFGEKKVKDFLKFRPLASAENDSQSGMNILQYCDWQYAMINDRFSRSIMHQNAVQSVHCQRRCLCRMAA